MSEEKSDLIRRQDAIELLREAENHAFNGLYKGLVKAHKIIANLPSAEPERKQGEWIPQHGGGYRCSKCGDYALDMVDGNFIHVSVKSKFCPNCGTYMKNKNE